MFDVICVLSSLVLPVQPCPALPCLLASQFCFSPTGWFSFVRLFVCFLLIKAYFPPAIGSSLSSIHPIPDSYHCEYAKLTLTVNEMWKLLLNRMNIISSCISFSANTGSTSYVIYRYCTFIPRVACSEFLHFSEVIYSKTPRSHML